MDWFFQSLGTPPSGYGYGQHPYPVQGQYPHPCPPHGHYSDIDRYHAQENVAAAQLDYQGFMYDDFLRSLDAQQGTNFRSQDLSYLDAMVLAAQIRGWRSVM